MSAMATKKNYLYFGSEKMISPVSDDFEFDESDVWNSAHVEPKRPFFGAKKFMTRNDHAGDHRGDVTSTSVPVNVMDWSKVLRGEYKNRMGEIEEDENENEDERVPPHEYLARTRAASCSVHEGIGRTLKGRDMRMVRNAVWKHTGFED
uniref:Senescence regulator S40 n=2 Tax=Daucus carota subsp. sativus TaxID=79200 RepID=A0A162A0Y7_DAUCS|nr:PREDICTED: uncharacterized protein LOC108222158 [Daucus carota subsp. sativus]